MIPKCNDQLNGARDMHKNISSSMSGLQGLQLEVGVLGG